jgi:hypothetical protein
VNAGHAITTAAPVPTDAQPQTNTDCGSWHEVRYHADCFLTKGHSNVYIGGERRGLLYYLAEVCDIPERLLLSKPPSRLDLFQPLGQNFILREGCRKYRYLRRLSSDDGKLYVHQASLNHIYSNSYCHCRSLADCVRYYLGLQDISKCIWQQFC